MGYAAIDPDGVLAMAASTQIASFEVSGIGTDAQRAIDGVSHLVPGAPAAGTRSSSVAERLAGLAGTAEQRALSYSESQRPANAWRSGDYWLPDLGVFGPRPGETVSEYLERVASSSEFGALPLGTAQGLLERYRNPRIAVPTTVAGAQQTQEIVRKTVQVPRPPVVAHHGGVAYSRTPGGLLVQTSSLHFDAQRAAGRGLPELADRHWRAGPHLAGDRAASTGPRWATRAGRVLGPVGYGLTAYSAARDQWAYDQRHNPDWGTGQRVASATYTSGATVAGAAAGAWGGAKVGAAIGAFGGPVGIAVGGIVGGVVGGFVGGGAGAAIADGAKKLWNGLFG